jgi:hypothetical protein
MGLVDMLNWGQPVLTGHQCLTPQPLPFAAIPVADGKMALVLFCGEAKVTLSPFLRGGIS